MNRYLSIGFIGSLLLIFLVGVCIAEEAPSYVAYVQGGQSTITNGSDGMMVITIKDIVPYVHIADKDKSRLIPVERLTNITCPLNTAVVFSDADNESVSMVAITNLSLSDGNKMLILQVTPLGYYEGEKLKDFGKAATPLANASSSIYSQAGIYVEMPILPQENTVDCCPCFYHFDCWCGADTFYNIPPC